ncbi:MAG: hypothetical protein ACR2FE_07855 [Aeromicrobium sp.]
MSENEWFTSFVGATASAAHGFLLGQLGWLVADLDEATRRSALDTLMRMMQEHETDDGALFRSAMWLVTARRTERCATRRHPRSRTLAAGQS